MDFLELLNRVENNDERKKQILELEKYFDQSLPPITKLFFQLYEGGNYVDKHPFRYYYDELKNGVLDFCEIVPAANTDFLIYDFMPLNEIRSNMEKVYPQEHLVWKEKLISIAETSSQGYIHISLKKETCDNVYIDFPGEDDFKFLADNIFELLMNTKVNTLDKRIRNGKVEDLYKKWGEEIWRIGKE